MTPRSRNATDEPSPGPATTAIPDTVSGIGSPVLDPITGKPCVDAKTGRPYIVGPDGKPVVAPVTIPPPAERVQRLEDAVAALARFVVENQLVRFSRSLMAPDAGAKVAAFLAVIAAERESEGK
jgi:hypothetical protein